MHCRRDQSQFLLEDVDHYPRDNRKFPKELRQKRHDVRIILPKYKTIRGQEYGIKETGEWVHIPMGAGRTESADIRAGLARVGIDLEEVAQQLEKEAVRKFVEPFDKLQGWLEERRAK